MTKPQKAAFFTLGCRVNHYETRAVEESFTAHGFSIGDFGEKCDVYVINTCTVTAESDRKSGQMIRRARATGGVDAVVIALGCMVQIDPEKTGKIDGVDACLGTKDKMRCVDVALALLAAKSGGKTPPMTDAAPVCAPMRVTGADTTRAFIKIADGCDNACAYCIIPRARGKVISRTASDVLEEIRRVLDAGYREVVLTGIETAAYGKDLDGETLVSLVEKADNLPLARIRLGSLEPSFVKEDAAARFAACAHFMPHVHLSLQSGSSKTLAAMRRKYNARQFEAVCDRLYARIPDLLITTDIIVGFPGETEDDFEETCAMVRRERFLFCHIFPYSDREGTEASKMPDKVPETVKKDRAARLKTVMLETRRSVLTERLCKTYPVLVETVENGIACGHTPNFIEVRFPAADMTTKNDIVPVTLTALPENLAFVYGEICHD